MFSNVSVWIIIYKSLTEAVEILVSMSKITYFDFFFLGNKDKC